MRIGVMGLHYGHIGGMFRSAARAANGEMVGIVEADDVLYERYTKERKVPRYRTLDEMLERARPELVLEGLTHRAKTEYVEKCSAAGAHLLLDKPLCYGLEDWARMREAVRKAGVKMSMWFTSRSHPPFIALREAILAGELGEIVSLISTHPHKVSRESGPAWYFDPKAYTGTFHDVACHGVDQVRWLTGAECVGVHGLDTCKKFTDPPRLTDHAQASFRMSNGALAVLTADWLTPKDSPSFGDTRFILMGTKGSAHLRAYAGDHLLIVADGRGAYEPKLPPAGHDVFVQAMIESMSRGQECLISTSDVLAVSRACLMAQESARRGGEYLTIE